MILAKDGCVHSPFQAGADPLLFARQPLLPLVVVEKIFAHADVESALRDVLREYPIAMIAIAVASPSLHGVVEEWLSGTPLKNPRALHKALLYVLRMASRCTPFGIFAGIGPLAVGSATTLQPNQPQDMRTYTRPSIPWLRAIVRSQERVDGSWNDACMVYLNNVVMMTNERVYVLEQPCAEDKASVAQTSARRTPGYEYIAELLSTQAEMRVDDLRRAIAKQFGVSELRAANLLATLFEVGLILPADRPAAIGDQVERTLNRSRSFSPQTAAKIDSVMVMCHSLDEGSLTQRASLHYLSLHSVLRGMAETEELPYQVDAHYQYKGSLSTRVLKDAGILARLLLTEYVRPAMQQCIDRFEQRYERSDRLVPLSELMNLNIVSEILNESPSAPTSGKVSERDRSISTIVNAAIAAGRLEVNLDTETLASVISTPEVDWDRVFPSMEFGFSLLAEDPQDIDCGNYMMFPSAMAGTVAAGQSIGRFLPVLGGDHANRIARTLVNATESNVMLVELNAVPRSPSFANVVVRPRVLAHEICLAAPRSANAEELSLDDILVGVRKGAFVFWSRRHKRAVHFHSSHVGNFAKHGDATARFLASVGTHHRIGPATFDWGIFGAMSAFTPRLRYGRYILSLARWRLSLGAIRDAADRAAALTTWRNQWNVPRYVQLSQGDKCLPVDLESPIGVEILLSAAANDQNEALIEEFLPLQSTWLRDGVASYSMEFVLSLNRSIGMAARSVDEDLSGNACTSGPLRVYPPGSEWLYFQIFCGQPVHDDLLVDHVAPLIRDLEDQLLLSTWHFLRYDTGGPQVRLRIKVSSGHHRLAEERCISMLQRLIDDRVIERFIIGAYEPEIERYGGAAALEFIENVVFRASSNFALEGLRDHSEKEHERLVHAIVSLDNVLRTTVRRDTFMNWVKGIELKHHQTSPEERTVIRDVQRIIDSSGPVTFANSALSDPESIASLETLVPMRDARRRVIDSIAHMHFNRFALHGAAEQKAYRLLRQVHAKYFTAMRSAISEEPLFPQHLATVDS